jgi:hypothetical protein
LSFHLAMPAVELYFFFAEVGVDHRGQEPAFLVVNYLEAQGNELL